MKALVLSGGGSKGSYQIGAWKALKKLHQKFDIVVGTSVGAMNGAMIVQNKYWKALNIWKKINMKFLFGEDAIESSKNFDIYKMYGHNFLKNGGMDIKELDKLIKENVNIKKFYSSKINYGLVTYNITNKTALELEKKDIKKELLADYIMASATCFPAFQQKKIDGKNYIDGGFYDNLPINLAIRMGATEIIAVDLSAPGIKKHPKNKVKTTYIKPKNKLTNFLNFYEKGAMNNIKYGYNDTMKAFNVFEGNKYTFKKKSLSKNKDLYKDTFLYTLNNILKYKKIKKTFEELIKTNINIDDKMKNDIIEHLLLNIMENLAKSFKLDNTKVYTSTTFNKALKKKLKNYLKAETLSNTKTSKKEIEIYKMIMDNNLSTIRKQALINPIDTLKAVYLYTICEA